MQALPGQRSSLCLADQKIDHLHGRLSHINEVSFDYLFASDRSPVISNKTFRKHLNRV